MPSRFFKAVKKILSSTTVFFSSDIISTILRIYNAFTFKHVLLTKHLFLVSINTLRRTSGGEQGNC